MKLSKVITTVYAAVFAMLTLGASTAMSAEPIKAEYPVLITSFGQAPDGNTISVLARRMGVETTYETLATPERVKDFKTVLVSIGVSLKGFGAAGVNLDTELARAGEILKMAKENNIKVVGVHIGGEGRRDQMSNRIIETYGKDFDTLVVFKDGDKDGIFAKMAQESNTPIIEVDRLADVSGALQQILK